ncbi:MAG: polysaccharide deacetylase family protein [Clostridia bacterium]|nr:polysaccharide deacetylase family protein [Clostridia bacterium]
MKIAIVKKNLVTKICSFCFAFLFVCAVVFSFGQTEHTSASNRKIPVYKVDTQNKVVSLTFDAAWGADKTLAILDILDEYNVKATFFLVGFWVDNFADMAKQIDARGHEIGTHSQTHPHMPTLTADKMRDELATSSQKITDITGKKVTLFRPPFGDYNNTLVSVCEDMGILPIQWDVDSLDWKGLSASQIHDRVAKRVGNGSIVLFHNNSDNILEALPLVIQTLQLKKFSFAPVGQVVYTSDYYVDNNGVQHKKETHQGDIL